MEVSKIGVANVKNVQNAGATKQNYDYLWEADKDIIDANVKYAEEQRKKQLANEIAGFQEQLKGANGVVEIFNRFGIEAKEDKDGKLTLSEYKQPSVRVTYKDLGVDEEALMANVKEITGNANFSKTSLTNIDSVEKIGGKADLSFSKVKSMKNLKEVGSIAQFNNSLIEELPNLKYVGAMANLSNTRVKELPALEEVNGNADFQNTPIEKMPALKKVKGDLNIIDTKMTKDDVANVEVGGKVKDKKDPVLPIKQDYSYLWDNSDRVEHNKQHQ